MKKLALLSAILCLFSAHAFAAPTSAKLNLRYTKQGDFRVRIAMNETSREKCNVRLFGRLSNTDGRGKIEKRVYLGLRRSRGNVFRFEAGDLPPVRRVRPGNGINSVAKLSVQAQITCGDNEPFLSAVDANYLDCGFTRKRTITANQFIDLVIRALR